MSYPYGKENRSIAPRATAPDSLHDRAFRRTTFAHNDRTNRIFNKSSLYGKHKISTAENSNGHVDRALKFLKAAPPLILFCLPQPVAKAVQCQDGFMALFDRLCNKKRF